MMVERQDLYLWGRNDPPRRNLSSSSRLGFLTRWAKLTTGPFCTSIMERLKCLPGQRAIDSRRLNVNARLLDTTSLVTNVEDPKKPCEPPSKLIPLFAKSGLGLFKIYRVETLRMSSSILAHSTTKSQQSLHLQRLRHTFSVLTKLTTVTEVMLKVLSDLMEPLDRHLYYTMLIIEAVKHYGPLCAIRVYTAPGELQNQPFISSLLGSISSHCRLTTRLDISILPLFRRRILFGSWRRPLFLRRNLKIRLGAALLCEHLSQVQTEQDFLVTRSGYFGRCPKGVAKNGYQIAILGGAYRLCA